MALDREMTPEEKAKHREWQAAEILRRRGVLFGPPSVEPKPATKPVGACPECGTPYTRQPGRKRCYRCRPKGAAHPKPSPPAPDPEPVVSEPVVVESPPDSSPSPTASPTDPIAALGRVVEILAGLDDATALWVLRSARRLPRPGAER